MSVRHNNASNSGNTTIGGILSLIVTFIVVLCELMG